MGKGHFGSGVVALVLALVNQGCSTPLPAAASGQQCLLDTDCVCGGEAGCFVCLNHVCTADLSSIVSFEDAGNGNPAPPPVPSDAAMEDVPTSPPSTMDAADGNPVPVVEAGPPEAETQPQADSAVVPAESSVPVADGASMQDSAPSDE
jgi:hypothetical protein